MAVDKALADALKKARGGQAMHFAFLPKGMDGAMLVDKKLAPKVLSLKKQAIGASSIIQGRVLGEGNALVFEVAAEPPATLKDSLLKRLKVDAGLTIPIVIRVKGDAAAAGAGDAAILPPMEGQGAGGEGIAEGEEFFDPIEEDEPLAEADQDASEEIAETEEAQRANEGLVRSRLNRLNDSIKEALKGPNAREVQGLFVSVNSLLKAGELEEATLTLEKLEAVLQSNGGAAKPNAAEPNNGVSLVVLQQARLAWDTARKKIQADLQKLEKEIVASAVGQEEFDPDSVALGARRLYGILEELDTGLLDTLDEALQTQDPKERQDLQKEAAALIRGYQAFIENDPLMALIDDNGFAPVAVRKTASVALTLLASKL